MYECFQMTFRRFASQNVVDICLFQAFEALRSRIRLATVTVFCHRRTISQRFQITLLSEYRLAAVNFYCILATHLSPSEGIMLPTRIYACRQSQYHLQSHSKWELVSIYITLLNTLRSRVISSHLSTRRISEGNNHSVYRLSDQILWKVSNSIFQ